MTAITTRAGKGSPLTNTEVDANFTNLNNDKIEKTGGAITANSTDPALTITQTGTGEALRVEDSASPDSTPFVIDQSGRVFIGSGTGIDLPDFSGTQRSPPLEVIAETYANSTVGIICNPGAFPGSGSINLAKSRGTNASPNTIVASGDNLGTLNFSGNDGVAFIRSAFITAQVDDTPGTNDMPGRLIFSTTANGASNPTERMRIDSAGRIGFGGTPIESGYSFSFKRDTTGSTTSACISARPLVRSDVTTLATVYQSAPSVEAATFTLGNLRHFEVNQSAIGAGATVTNQFGYYANGNLTGATNNFGFFGNIPSGAGRYNFYAAGTASNYFAGNVSIGGAAYSGTANQDLLQIRHSNSGGSVRAQVVNPNTTANTAARFDFSTGTVNAYGILEVVEDGAGNATVSLSTGAGVNGGIRLNPTVGNVTVNTASGLGYGTGAGGTVTQATSKSTAVTLNKPCGQITMNNAALAAGASVSFTLNNSLIATSDVVLLTPCGGFSVSGNYSMRVGNTQTGAISVFVKNESAGSLSEAVIINFAIIKGATA